MKYSKRSQGFKNKYDRSWQSNLNKNSKHLAIAKKHLDNGDYDAFKKEFDIANEYQAKSMIALRKRTIAYARSEPGRRDMSQWEIIKSGWRGKQVNPK